MSLIEGIGDEVTVGCGILLLLCLVLLAWFSTHTREIPFVSIIVVELSQRRRLRNRSEANAENSSVNDQSAAATSATERDTNHTEEAVSSESQSELGSISAEAASKYSSHEQTSRPHVTDSSKSKDETSRQSAGDTSGVASASETVMRENVETEPSSSAVGNVSTGTSHSKDSAGCKKAVPEHKAEVSTDCVTTVPPCLKTDPDSPDEVRKRRVMYFESSTKKEDTENNEECGTYSDIAASGAISSTATPASAENLVQSSESISKLSTASAAQSQEADAGESSEVVSSTSAGVSASENIGTSAPGAEESNATDTSENIASDSQQIRVRLKYLNDTQRLVYASPGETIGSFRRTHFSTELDENKIVRFIFNGQDLRNDLWTLGAYNIADNSVIHCLITQSRQQPDAPNSNHALGDDDLELGVFIYPIFGLILGVLWYFRFSYKQYFNAVSTVSLAGVSFIYCLALVSSLRGRQRQHQHLD